MQIATEVNIEPPPALTLLAGDEPRIDSRQLATHLGLQHHSVFKLVREHGAEFSQLGIVGFQIQQSVGPGRPERYALLNEGHCYLLLTFSRNNSNICALKVRLVQAFMQARLAIDLRNAEYLPSYHTLHDEVAHLAAESRNGKFVHMNFNKLLNRTVGLESGERATMEVGQCALMVVAQNVAKAALAGCHDHHDGYARAKARLAELRTAVVGPDPAPAPRGRRKKLPKAA